MGAVDRLHWHGHRRRAGRFPRRQARPQDGVHRHNDRVRTRQRCHGILVDAARALGGTLRDRPRSGRRTAGRLHARLRILAGQAARPHHGAARIVLGGRLDSRRDDRLFRDSKHRRLGLALGAAHRRHPAALCDCRAPPPARVRALPRGPWRQRTRRGLRPLLRTSLGCRRRAIETRQETG